MSEGSKVSGIIVSPEALIVFPNFFEPKQFKDPKTQKPKGEPMYGGLFGFDPDEVKSMKDKAIEVARAKFPGRPLNELRFPFMSGDKEAEKAKARGHDGAFYAGKVWIKASTQYAIQVLGPDGKTEWTKDGPHARKVYSGCMGYAEFNFDAYDGVNGGQDGVKAYLNFVMISKTDTPRVAGRDARSAFAGITGGKSAHNPVDELDDEIPL